MAKLRRDAPISVSAMMFDRHFLNGSPDHGLFDVRLLALKPSVEPSPADLCQHAHTFYTQLALQRRHRFGDVVVDAAPPVLPLLRRRAPTLSKALLKKSASSAFSASATFSWTTSFFKAVIAGVSTTGP